MASTPSAPRAKVHHGEACWFTCWYDDGVAGPDGKIRRNRRDKWFGKVSEVPERQARAAFNLWMARWRAEDRVRNPKAKEHTYTATQLAVDYLAYARATFIKNGRMTSHVWEVAYAMQALTDAFGTRPASSVTAPELAQLRESMIRATDKNGTEYIRSIRTVNGRLLVIKQAYIWARERGIVTREALSDIVIVKPLVAGRCDATAPQEVAPVDEHWVALAKEKAPSQIQAMIDLQWLTGMRPNEACIARLCDMDRTGKVWLYTPASHKMEHKGKKRIIPLGPRAQKVIEPFLERPTDAYLFSPAEAYRQRLQTRREKRKQQKYPSWYRTPTENPASGRGDVYSVQSYRKAIHYACELAQIAKWNPNQLRHAAATRFNRMFSLEDIAVTLGHSDVSTTRIYALPDVSRAVKIARKVG